MSSEDETEFHGTAEVRRDGLTITVELPSEAVERSGIETGENVLVGSLEDGPITLVPWSGDNLRESMGTDE